jgi:hypothetical protein
MNSAVQAAPAAPMVGVSLEPVTSRAARVARLVREAQRAPAAEAQVAPAAERENQVPEA